MFWLILLLTSLLTGLLALVSAWLEEVVQVTWRTWTGLCASCTELSCVEASVASEEEAVVNLFFTSLDDSSRLSRRTGILFLCSLDFIAFTVIVAVIMPSTLNNQG